MSMGLWVYVWACECECVWESVTELRVCFPDRVQQCPTGARNGSRVSHVCFSLLMRAFHIRGSECVGVCSSAWTTLACVYLHSCLVYTCSGVCVCTLCTSANTLPGSGLRWWREYIKQTYQLNLLKSSCVSSIWQTDVSIIKYINSITARKYKSEESISMLCSFTRLLHFTPE